MHAPRGRPLPWAGRKGGRSVLEGPELGWGKKCGNEETKRELNSSPARASSGGEGVKKSFRCRRGEWAMTSRQDVHTRCAETRSVRREVWERMSSISSGMRTTGCGGGGGERAAGAERARRRARRRSDLERGRVVRRKRVADGQSGGGEDIVSLVGGGGEGGVGWECE